MAKVVTFGELMLRLAPNGYYRFFQNDQMQATFGGGEANVAVSLANYGEDAAFLTVLPDNAIADACKAELRRFDVDTKRIVTGEGRMGIYYLEGGANQRPSKVVYDRAYSAIALAKPGDIDWDKAFDGVEWFHITGITPAISESAMELSVASVKEAKKRGITVSCGTDLPLLLPNIPEAIYCGVGGHFADGGTYNEQNMLTVPEMLTAWTKNGQYNCYNEDRLGTLEAGKLADIAVLDGDVFTMPNEQVKDVKVALTISDGRIVHKAL